MNVVSKRTLVRFWTGHAQAERPLTAWYLLASKAQWETPNDGKAQFGANVDFVGDERAIFDIAGNKYRLIVRISYLYKAVLIKFVGIHAAYDRIDPERI